MTAPIDKYSSMPINDWIEKCPNELEYDAIGLWQIVSAGRERFDLTQPALDEFVARCVEAIISKGGNPVLPGEPGEIWEKQLQYGKTAQDISRNILAEWHKTNIDPDHDGIWFALDGYS